MIVFDERTLQILKYVKCHNKRGVTWGKLQLKFGRNDANIFYWKS